MDEYILSIDLGTSAIKVAIVSSYGKIIATSNQEYSLSTPSVLEVELSVEVYWKAFKAGIKDVLNTSAVEKAKIKAMGFSVQGETIVFVDNKGQALRDAIVWMDNRAHSQTEELKDKFKHTDVYSITGQPEIVPTWPAAKILWYKQNQRALFDKTKYFLLLEDYFIFRLCNEVVAEGSLLSSTLYWDIRKKTYWKEMLDYLEINESQLPKICESGEKMGNILPEIADELGLSTSTMVCTGVLDQVAGSIGVGNVVPGIFSECTGSALAIVATVKEAFVDPSRQMPCHYHGMEDTYMAHTFTTGGMVFKWFRDTFGTLEKSYQDLVGIDAYESLISLASQVAPGADGLIALPHWQGALSPENNPKAKGVFYGITLAHKKGHFVRSILESITFIIKKNIEVLDTMGIHVDHVRSIGGGAKSDLWMQLKADILGVPTVSMENDEAACVGAAIIAGVAVNMFSSVKEAVTQMVKENKVFQPNNSVKDVYAKNYAKYIKLYDALQEMFEFDSKL